MVSLVALVYNSIKTKKFTYLSYYRSFSIRRVFVIIKKKKKFNYKKIK